MNQEVTNWGYSLSLDVAGAEHDSITSYDVIYDFTIDLVDRIAMVRYEDPKIVKFGTGNKAGFTLVQLIETSSIAAHFCDDTDTFYIDVFSCKEFSIEDVKDCIKDYFGENCSFKTHYFERQA
jgi:S-adenosylmethionine/arginine decarboxylase-like enzyme